MSYLPVNIHNSTDYPCKGTVTYHTDKKLCTDEDYSIEPHGDWEGTSRGVCLIRVITGTLSINDVSVDLIPYDGVGTRSNFVVTETGASRYAILPA